MLASTVLFLMDLRKNSVKNKCGKSCGKPKTLQGKGHSSHRRNAQISQRNIAYDFPILKTSVITIFQTNNRSIITQRHSRSTQETLCLSMQYFPQCFCNTSQCNVERKQKQNSSHMDSLTDVSAGKLTFVNTAFAQM